MFEAKLAEGNILKKIIEAIKDIVNDVNIDVSPSGKSSSHFIISFHQIKSSLSNKKLRNGKTISNMKKQVAREN